MEYPKIRLLGHEENRGILSGGDIVVLEKIDGANFRMKYHRESGELMFGSRGVLFKEYNEPAPFERINKQFRHTVSYVNNNINLDVLVEKDNEYGGLWIFGESLHKHRIDYDAWDGKHPKVDSDIPNFLGFDVYSQDYERFLPHDMVEELFDDIGLETVPIVDSGNAENFSPDDFEVPQSAFRTPNNEAGTDFNRRGLAEGIVIKNTGRDIRACVVASEFDEQSLPDKPPSERWQISSEAAEFVERYATDARIEKQAHKLIDDGSYQSLRMEMMQDLPRRVIEDIFAEHGWDILNNDELDLTAEVKSEIRSQLSKRCSRVLQQVMREQAW